MIGLLSMVLPVIGSAGFGAVLKIMGGLVEGISTRRAEHARFQAATRLAELKASVAFQRAVFGGDSPSSAAARNTRRIIAVIGVLNFAAITLAGVWWPNVELVTFAAADSTGPVSILWGLVSFPSDASRTVTVTTGHLAVSGLCTLSMIFGFYFTPGGSK